ncbi:3'(2'),5'-bisphosphate nucleotidase CysQ [Carboxylicivirga mesophila]|uniref:3'(2'),5'-bisphosphate nucleotidase CysQ n=1 Tax=Carboxylicivirga mesophila TaxID=1166478 RepID=A0ABS5K5G8_9BACT|nr:3'(2'),5'-bisphosphate nucleotidase CysQ [Carboxylicivirga mesophila]MBS2210231.1 3'(2'),5'-bisphosphate nucleotidase CysQ [Carboxylicivirga mesophila]
MNQHTYLVIKASLEAGKEILKVFNSDDFGVRLKSDDSPLTEADLKSHQVIASYLDATDIPVLSEEGDAIEYNQRSGWTKLWIVDPLDGTKEFVKRSGEFTVNIALVEDQRPIMGVVFAPYLGWLYWGDASGAYKAELADDWQDMNVDELLENVVGIQLPCQEAEVCTVVASVSHFSKETETFVKALEEKEGTVNVVSRGSSLKMCLVAEGAAHLYPRLGPTMEWDTAAGQAVVEASGGQLFDWHSKAPMKYNRKDLLNGWFLTLAKGLNAADYWLL